MISAALTILGKDLRLRARDRSVLLFAFVVPMALTLVFSLIFPSDDDFLLTVAVVDEDGGPIAAAFTQEFVPALVNQGFVDATYLDSADVARQMVDDGEVSAAWLLPEGFSGQVMAGSPAELTVLHNPDRALSTEVARGIAEGFLTEIRRVSLSVATTATAAGSAFDPRQVDAITAQAAATSALLTVGGLDTEVRQLDPTSYLGAGMAVFFLFFTVTFGITGLLEEREQRTLPRLLAAPIGVGAVHLGKATGAFVIGVVSMTVLALGNRLVLGVDWGPPLGVAVIVVAGVLCALGVMALVGSYATTVEQAGNLQSIVAMAFGLSGGVFFPVGATGWMASLSLFSPHGWFLRGLGDQVGAGSWTGVLPAAGVLLAIGVVTGSLGALRLRKVTA
ncbi:MAG: ABC transporter permease [Nitriliruptoraceae bacterium]